MEEGIYVGVIVVLLMVIMYLLYTRKDMNYVMGKTNSIVGKPDDAYYVKDLDNYIDEDEKYIRSILKRYNIKFVEYVNTTYKIDTVTINDVKNALSNAFLEKEAYENSGRNTRYVDKRINVLKHLHNNLTSNNKG